MPIGLIEQFEKDHNRTLPFTYFFKGINEFEKQNYVQAIENF